MNKEERLKLDGYEGIEPVLFYRPGGPYGFGSNFSSHRVVLPCPFTKRPVNYESGEHRFQAMKATTLEDHDRIVVARSAYEAKELGRAIDLRPDWGNTRGATCYLVMYQVVLAKTLQHSTVMRSLLETGDRPIYEDSPVDDIWGWRYAEDYRGKNLLGICWMEVRHYLGGGSGW